MGDIADMMIDGVLDAYTGEYIDKAVGIPRTLNGSLPWEKRSKPKMNPRYGVMNFLNNRFVGLREMPSQIGIVKLYAKEHNLVYNSEDELFEKISADFGKFSGWVLKNLSTLIHIRKQKSHENHNIP